MRFPRGQAGNVVRGALGAILHKIASAADYTRIFEPASPGTGPSGLASRPRPFVIRAGSLDGQIVEPGVEFSVGLNLFDAGVLTHFEQAFANWAELVSVDRDPVTVDLNANSVRIRRIRVEFQTPTELKTAAGTPDADFSVLLARARDRVSTLRGLYGAGPSEIDFRGLAERARSVKTVRCELRHVAVERRSSRTGQRHGIGGFIGIAEYEGDLAEFVPYLKAAYWTGVGRHCTWGNGQIQTAILNS